MQDTGDNNIRSKQIIRNGVGHFKWVQVIGFPRIASLNAMVFFGVVNSLFNFSKVYFILSLLFYTI